MQLGRLRAAYARLPAPVRARIPPRLEDWLRARATLDPVAELEHRLWGGFSRPARAGLEALLGPATPPRTAAAAALALARWSGVDDPEAALALAQAARARRPALARDRRQFMLEALFLARTGQGAAARALLETRVRFDASAALLAAGTLDDGPRLAALNALLARFGLGPLARRDDGPLSLDNLRGVTACARRDGPLVTVIVPVHDAEATLAAALRSLQDQTHAALEVLVVDDASTDASAAIAAGFTADPRFRLIRQPTNLGGYAARNRALAEARGAFVTVQDADDWSHPERIARQLAAGPVTVSDWARATSELRFRGPWRPSPNLISTNFSSLCFPRELVTRCGPWDTARVSADREFAERLARYGVRPRQVAPGAPLAFGRVASDSLTRVPATHAATLLHGVRREYREAAALWHADLTGPPGAPPFVAAPRIILSAPGSEPAHDLLFIADFNLRGGAFQSALHMIRAARAAGLDCAAFHYRRYDLDPTRPLDPGFRRRARDLGVRIVAPGERVRAATVIVTYPAVFDQPLDRFPEVDHDRLAVVVNQMAERDLARTDPAYDPARVRAHLVELLGAEGLWLPISPRVRALMDARYPRPHPETWTPLIDLAEWQTPPRTPGPRPVIGRHGRDDPLKWPRDPAALAAAYCAGRPCDVRFLGGARHARARIRWPRNWHVQPFGGDVRAFLAGLDVFVHLPDPDYVEEFGRAALEAMAADVPVILAPEFAPTFGDAALYAAPDQVWGLVERLWRDPGFRAGRVAAGRAFARTCGYDAFPARLARLQAPPRAVSA
jgi:glycosyltransferase involved in cell wall biosynthesis